MTGLKQKLCAVLLALLWFATVGDAQAQQTLKALQSLQSVRSYGASGSAATTTGTIGASSAALTLAGTSGFANGQGILVNHAGAALSGSITAPSGLAVTAHNATGGATTYCYQVASVDNAGGVGIATSPVCTTVGAATLGNFDVNLSRSYNYVPWTKGTGASYTAVWRNTNGGAYCLLGEFSGAEIDDQVVPCTTTLFWIPSTPTVSALSDWLQTTVTAGGGTTALTLAAAATTAATTTYVQHDDTAAIAAAAVAGPGIYFPCGTYNITDLLLTSTIVTINGAGRDCAKIIGSAGSPSTTTASDPSLLFFTLYTWFTARSVTNLSITTNAPMGIASLGFFGGFGAHQTGGTFSNLILNGATGFSCVNMDWINVENDIFTNWWGNGIASQGCLHANIIANQFQPLGGEPGDFYCTAACLFGISINSSADNWAFVVGNHISQYGGTFGIGVGGDNSVVEDNYIECSGHEAMGIAGSHSKFSGNSLYWKGSGPVAGDPPSACKSGDFGMSSQPLSGTWADTEVSNNKIEGSGAAGYAFGGGGAGCIDKFNVTGNTFISDANSGTTATVSVNGCATNTIIGTNTFLNPLTQYLVNEVTAGGLTPANTTIAAQLGPPGTTGTVLVTAATSHYLTKPVAVAGPSSY